MVGDKLFWRLSSEVANERMLACDIIPRLRITITKQLTVKLIELMWSDSHRGVKKAAAQALGRIGRGRDVYDELHNRLSSSRVLDKIEALGKIRYIGIMTNKLLDVYINCFSDYSIKVREWACRSAQYLIERDERVLDAVVRMAMYDRAARLKVLAIQTLALVANFRSHGVRKCLLWALQFELDALIRTEACHCIVLLLDADANDALAEAGNNSKMFGTTLLGSMQKQIDQELIDILMERYLVEEEEIVKK